MVGMRFLIVEDEEILRDLYKDEIGDFFPQSQIFTAENGLCALDIMAQNTVDLIVTDGRMPEMDGVSFARKVRSLGNSVPIILITGFVKESDSAKEEMLFNFMLDKPVDFQKLVQCIKTLV